MTTKPDIFLPVKPEHINQNFGDNIPCVKNFGLSNQVVVDGLNNNTCPAGFDKLYAHFGMSGHNGTDLKAGEQNIYAGLGGKVIEKQIVPARGLGLGILTDEQYDFGPLGVHYLKLRYWHLKSFYCEVGDVIKPGQLIGISDNTGYSSANHLHFEGQPMDKDAGGHPVYVWTNAAFPPGVIAGAIDIAPYFNGKFAEDIPKLISLDTALVGLLIKIINLIKSRQNKV